MADKFTPRSGDDYAGALANLLPQGLAWPRDPTTTLMKLVNGLAQIFGYVDGQATLFLVQESDPRATLLMLPDWERNWGLPDECLADPLTISDRRTMLMQRMTLLGAQSRQFFIQEAARIGYTISSIREFSPFMCGVSRCGDTRPILVNDEVPDGIHYRWEIGDVTMRFYWVVTVAGPRLSYFYVSSGQCGIDPLLRISHATDLECLLRKWGPAHDIVLFKYGNLPVDQDAVLAASASLAATVTQRLAALSRLSVGTAVTAKHYTRLAAKAALPASSSVIVSAQVPGGHIVWTATARMALTGLVAADTTLSFLGGISSAGVFDSTGALVRTLWSAQTDDPRVSNPVAAWDGTLDNIDVAATGSYTIKLLQHKTNYAWEGVIGNSSPDHSNVSVDSNRVLSYYHSYAGAINDMAISPTGEMYFVTGYDERLNTVHVTTTGNPQYANSILPQAFRGTLLNQLNCCTDGTIAYFHWWDSGGNSSENAVWGVNCATKAIVTFSSGTGSYIGGNLIGEYGTAPGKFIFGIAVQQSGSYLFIARAEVESDFGNVWSIWTCNKTTGATVHINTPGFQYQGRICADPTTGALWIAHLNSTATASATWDTLNSSSSLIFSNGNRTVADGPANRVYAFSDGTGTKVYFEVVQNSNASGVSYANAIGVASTYGGLNSGGYLGNDATGAGYYGNGTFTSGTNNIQTGALPNFGVGDNIGIACDAPNKLIWMRVNGGQWNNSPTANPATGTGGLACPSLGSPVVAAIGFDQYNYAPPNSVLTGNFASSNWVYSVPAGFSQLPGVARTATVTKMNVDGGGNLTDSGVAATAGLAGQVGGLAVSPDGSTLLVLDSGSQQVKAFNTSDGSAKTAWGTSGALGLAGGYANGPAVTNTKFMFANYFVGMSGSGGWIAYAPDGSFWLGDCGNCRHLHFSSGNSPTYIEQIAYIPATNPTRVCYNDDTRVFGSYLEFSIDYSKSLAPGNGSWTLVNNWAYGVPGGIKGGSETMRYVFTGSNGRTYVPIPPGGTGTAVYEMTSSGYRDTGVVLNDVDYIDEQFNLWAIPTVNPYLGSVTATYYRNLFTGFDGSNNPTWQDSTLVAPSRLFMSSVALPSDFPVVQTPYWDNNPQDTTQPLSNGTIVVFAPESGGGYHLAGLDSTTGAIKFKTHALRNSNFATFDQGTVFPPTPYFVNATHPGGFQCHKSGATDFFTEFRGEEWGNNQTNIWSHWDQSGLLVNRVGVAAPYYGQFMTTTESPSLVSASTLAYLETLQDGVNAVPQRSGTYSFMGEPGLAGNAAWGGIAYQNGNYYLYHGDEWYHGGVHRWCVSNITSKQITSFPVSWNSSSYVAPSLVPYKFMSGLPFNTRNLPSGPSGWVRSPTGDFGTQGSAPWFHVYTNEHVIDPHLFPDLAFETNLNGMPDNSTATASYSWTRTGSGNWSITGTLWQQGYGSRWGVDNQRNLTYLDILDNAGKIIVRMYNGSDGYVGDSFWVNDLPITGPYTTASVWVLPAQFPNPPALSIIANVTAGTTTVSYAGFTMSDVALYDGTADIHHPAQFRITAAITIYGDGPKSLSFSNLQFADL